MKLSNLSEMEWPEKPVLVLANGYEANYDLRPFPSGSIFAQDAEHLEAVYGSLVVIGEKAFEILQEDHFSREFDRLEVWFRRVDWPLLFEFLSLQTTYTVVGFDKSSYWCRLRVGKEHEAGLEVRDLMELVRIPRSTTKAPQTFHPRIEGKSSRQTLEKLKAVNRAFPWLRKFIPGPIRVRIMKWFYR